MYLRFVSCMALLLISFSPLRANEYRDLTLQVRQKGSFKIFLPETLVKYEFEWGEPALQEPAIANFRFDTGTENFYRVFIDRIFLKRGASFLFIGERKLPLTCIFIKGHDNRFSGKDTPLVPDLLLEVYLVANDSSCTGPLNPGWPFSGGRPETWHTYLYYEVKDPTIMLPVEIKLRDFWNEHSAILFDGG